MSSRYQEQIDTKIYETRLEAALIEQHKKWFDYERGTLKNEYAEHIACPVCDAKDAVLRFEKDLFQFKKCSRCEMTYLSPRLNVEATYQFYNDPWSSRYNEAKFSHEGSITQIDDDINAANLRWIEEHRLDPNAPRGALLEIGFGAGYLLMAAEKAGYEVYGIDVDTANCEQARKRYGDRILNKDLPSAAFAAEKFDVVYMRDVFEHVPNPKPLLQEVNRILKKGGMVFIEVPNTESLIYKIVQQRHTCVFGFAHLNYWSRKTLKDVFSRTGFAFVNEKHEALDFTTGVISDYFLNKKFTMILPIPATRLQWAIAAFFKVLGSISIFRRVDNKLSPRIAEAFKQGSQIKVLGRK